MPYKNIIKAQIIYKVWWIVIVYFVIIFPFIVDVKTVYKKCEYCLVNIYLYNIKIVSFFIELKITKINFVFNKKTLQLDYYKIITLNNKVKSYVDIKFNRIKTSLIYGNQNQDKVYKAIIIFNSLQIIEQQIKNVFKVNTKSNFYLVNETSYFKANVKVNFVFNLVTVITIIAKIVIGVIIKWKKKIIE